MRSPGAVQAFNFFGSGLSLIDWYVRLACTLRPCICRLSISGLIVTKGAPVPSGAEPVETIVAVLRIFRAQLVELLRCEACPSCHVLYGLAVVRQQSRSCPPNVEGERG